MRYYRASSSEWQSNEEHNTEQLNCALLGKNYDIFSNDDAKLRSIVGAGLAPALHHRLRNIIGAGLAPALHRRPGLGGRFLKGNYVRHSSRPRIPAGTG